MLSPTNNVAGWNVDMEPGAYLVSMYVQASATGAMRVSMYNGSHRYSANATFNTVRQRLVFVCTATAFARAAITIYPNMSALAAGTDITIDSIMIEKMAGANTSTTPSPFVAGNSAASVSGQAAATSALDARVTQTETGLTTQAGQITSLNTGLAGKADNSALQSLASTVTQQGTTLTSQGAALTSITARIGTAETGIAGQATAIGSLDTRVTSTETQITAQATKLDGIYVQVNPALAGDDAGYAGSSTTFVGVWSEQSARIEDGVAVGRRVDNIQVTVDQNAATVQQVSQAQVAADGKASAMWSVKLQVNSQGQYVAAGIGLGIENGPAGLQSTFLVSADTFAVVNGINGTLSSPFAVTGGQVFIRSAFIQDGSITMLKIGDALQSDNYVAGTTGWRLTKAGVFEINGNVPGAGRMTMTNSALKVFDASGVKRVQLGDLSA
nr:DUF1983 domain-containing protein [Pseudomonas sp. RIT-PI-q]